MHAQRVRGAESRVGTQVVKWTVEGAGNRCLLATKYHAT